MRYVFGLRADSIYISLNLPKCPQFFCPGVKQGLETRFRGLKGRGKINKNSQRKTRMSGTAHQVLMGEIARNREFGGSRRTTSSSSGRGCLLGSIGSRGLTVSTERMTSNTVANLGTVLLSHASSSQQNPCLGLKDLS